MGAKGRSQLFEDIRTLWAQKEESNRGAPPACMRSSARLPASATAARPRGRSASGRRWWGRMSTPPCPRHRPRNRGCRADGASAHSLALIEENTAALRAAAAAKGVDYDAGCVAVAGLGRAADCDVAQPHESCAGAALLPAQGGPNETGATAACATRRLRYRDSEGQQVGVVPALPLERQLMLPRSFHWEPIADCVVTGDQKVLRNIPYVGDGDEAVSAGVRGGRACVGGF